VTGAFIVVEGPDGAGKTTLARRLVRRLRRHGLDVVEVRQPGGTPAAEAARRAALDPALDPSPIAELFFILAARADLVSKVIRPAIDAGKVVVSDRHDLSTRAYQVAGRQLPEAAVNGVIELATGGLRPDLDLVLTVPADVGLERRKVRGSEPDRMERADAETARRVAQAFQDAEGPGVVHLEAGARSSDEVEAAAWAILCARLPQLELPREDRVEHG
jgi:dTMP kinase